MRLLFPFLVIFNLPKVPEIPSFVEVFGKGQIKWSSAVFLFSSQTSLKGGRKLHSLDCWFIETGRLVECSVVFIIFKSPGFLPLLQFSDKLEGLEETLVSAVEQVDNAEPISAHPDKLRDQIADNKAILEDTELRLAALQSVTEAADDILKQKGMDDDAAKGGNY